MIDVQSGHEFTLTALIPALAGANMIYGVGMLDSALAWDYASALLQNEFLDMILKVVNGIQVSEKNIALDVIKDVGPAGEFITHEHTFDNFKKMIETVVEEFPNFKVATTTLRTVKTAGLRPSPSGTSR